jgi:hypothetical protein
LSAEKLKSRVLNSLPLSQRIPYSEQERDKLKKLINDIWDYRNHTFSIEDMNKKGYDSEAVFAINALYTALHNFVNRSKLQNKIQSLLPYQMAPSNIKYYNTISMLKVLLTWILT